jgi:hypothetical protein
MLQSHPYGKPEDVNSRKDSISPEIPEGEFDIVL